MTDTTPASAAAEDVHRLAQNLRDWAAETPVPTAVHAAAGWLTDLVRERDDAYAALKRGAGAQAYIDAHAHEVRLICDALEIDVPATADPIIEAVATLRRELAEARDARDEALAELDDWRATPPDVLQSVTERKLRSELGLAHSLAELNAKHWETALRERDEAVAETARVRTVYRDALARWRDELTQLRKAVTTIAARRERERPDDIIVDALRAALDGAATTGPETTPEGGAS